MFKKGTNEHDVLCEITTLGRFTYKELCGTMGLSRAQVTRAIKSLRKKGVIIQTTGGGEGSRMEQERYLKYCGHLPPKQKRGLHDSSL